MQELIMNKLVMEKKLIRLTENDLKQIVTESVKKVLSEGKLGSAYENLENAYELLQDIINSSFIPFSSPAPSRTEAELKDTIIEAARMIDKAKYLCGQLGYNEPRVNVV